MKKIWLYAFFISGVWLGSNLPAPIYGPARAASGDVYGSPNLSVDTYRNQKGTFVLWADGRITSSAGGSADLGRPYAAPPEEAEISARPPLIEKQPTGSPNLAVKAIPRPDATYVLFADGTLRKPAQADAAAPGLSGADVLAGSWGVSAPASEDFDVSADSGGARVQLREALPNSWSGFAVGYGESSYGANMPSGGQKFSQLLDVHLSADRKTLTFQTKPFPQGSTLVMESGQFLILKGGE